MMEVFTEEGIILEKKGDIAEIAIMDKGNCKTCAAKPFCSTNSDGVYSRLTVLDNLDAKPGDEVVVQVMGTDILKAVIMVYGIPLFLFIFTIGIVIYFYEGSPNKELISFLSAITVLAFYYGFLKLRGSSGKIDKKSLPKTVKIKRSFQSVNN